MLTIPDTAALLRVHRATVYRLVASGELARIKIGRAARITEDSLRGFIARGGTHRI